MSRAGWDDAHNILCIRLDSMGDVLMCTPAMRALHQVPPRRRLTLLTSGSGAAVAPYLDDVGDVITYAAPWMKHSMPCAAQADHALIHTLAARNFDAAVIFTSYSQSPLPAALLCQLAGIPLRLAHCRENPYQLLTDWLPDPEPAPVLRHEVQRQLDLVASIVGPSTGATLSFRVPDADLHAVRHRLENGGLDVSRPWVLVHPGASAASRRYPVAHLAAVVRALSEQHALPVLLAGGPAEASLIEQLRQLSRVPTHVVGGTLTVGELGAAFKLTHVAVLNNSGPAHMAAAIGTPVVSLYALTNPQHTPWRVASRVLIHDVPCRFCYKSQCPHGHHDCLEKLDPQDVVAAVSSLLQERLRD